MAETVPDEWKGFVQLSGVAAGDRTTATERIRDALSEVGAWITDVHFFSGIQTVLAFDVEAAALAALAGALERAGLALDESSRKTLAQAAAGAKAEVHGTLAITFVHGDPDLKHEVPSVPG